MDSKEQWLAFLRKEEEEWLDADSGSAEEVASALRSLRFVNRWFGGERVHRLLLDEAAGDRNELKVLEVAAGRATALAEAALWLRRRKTHPVVIRATLLDRQASHLPPDWPSELPAPALLPGDALAIPLADKSMDVVSCCLFLHHLAPSQIAIFLREALRVARVAVLINDLERSRLHFGLSKTFSLVDPSRLSKHDGPASVRQAYTRDEMLVMVRATGAKAKVRRRFLQRLAVTIWADESE